jgi:YjbE family integral membrane protein
MDTSFLVALTEVIMVNIILSGDNAVVIALAARRLPARQQKLAIVFGSGGAIVLRIALTIVAVELLRIPLLQFAGGLLLIWIAVKLLVEEDAGEAGEAANVGLLGAVKTILVADLIMSLDNTLAIAAVAKGSWAVLIFGLVLSVPLIVFGSTLIVKLIERFPMIVYGGAGLIAYTAGEMIDSDAAVAPYLPSLMHETPYLAMALTAGVIGYGAWDNRRRKRSAEAVLAADERAAQRLDQRLD